MYVCMYVKNVSGYFMKLRQKLLYRLLELFVFYLGVTAEAACSVRLCVELAAVERTGILELFLATLVLSTNMLPSIIIMA